MNRSGSRRWPAIFAAMLLLTGMAAAVCRATVKPDGRPNGGGGAGFSYAEGEVLVKFRAGATMGTAGVLAADLAVGNVRQFRLMSEARRRPYVLMRSSNLSTLELLAALRSRPEVEAVSPNYRRRLQRLPNDPKYSKLWGMAKISAPEAWERSVGSRDVVLAVIDTGVDYRHADLSANIWRNPGETAGNGSDDDNNGFVDDVYGYDFAADDSGGNDSDPMDIDVHGTHVAGTMAAVGNNGRGVCGVAWQARLMVVKAFRPDIYIYDSDCIEAIEYIVMMKRDYGVNVVAVNASFGGGGYNSLQRDAIAEAGEQGIAFVCAAGNEGISNDDAPFYPASYDLANIVVVAASNEEDALASFSNFGTETVDLAAPGASIFSTVPVGKGQEAWLRSAADDFEANPLEYSGLTAAAGLDRRIYDCGRGESAAVFPAALRGNIALIERGDITFEQKTINAQKAGAVGVVIYNNEAGNFSGTLGRKSDWVPVLSLSRADGLAVKARGVHSVNLTCRPADYGISDGTSMATPHVCGALGLLAARFPAEDMAQRLGRLYSGADRLATLEGKVRTGARLNLFRSLSQSLVLTMKVSRLWAEAWIVAKEYAEIRFVVEKEAGSAISGETYTIYRKSAGGGYQALKEIGAGEIQDGACVYQDKYLDEGFKYTYVVQAKNARGEIIALSNEQQI